MNELDQQVLNRMAEPNAHCPGCEAPLDDESWVALGIVRYPSCTCEPEPNENLHGFHTPRGDWPDRSRQDG